MGPHFTSHDQLILSIHAACLSQDSWPQVIGNLCEALHARGASLVRPVNNPRFEPSTTLFEFDAAFVKHYAEYWGQHDVWYEGAVRTRRLGVGLVTVADQLIDYRDYKRSPFFNEYLRPMDIDRMMNVCLAAPDSGFGPTAMSFYRGLGKEPFSDKETTFLSRLAPHLCVAVQNYWTVQSLRLLTLVHTNALDAITSGVFGVEPSGRVAFTNRTGEDLLRQGRWMQLSDRALSPSKGLLETAALTRALGQLAAGISFKLIVRERLTDAQAIVSGAPLTLAQAKGYPTQMSALVWLTPLLVNVDAAADFAKLFGLTFAERRLLGRLIIGDGLREAALSLHISLHTARTQLKSIFAKTGRRSQVALLTLVTRLSALRTPSA